MKKKRRSLKNQRFFLFFIGLFLVFLLTHTNELDSFFSTYNANESNELDDLSDTSLAFNEVLPSDGNLSVYFFDVGQADCILVSNSGENMLIDAGNNPDGKLIVDELKSMNINKIDYLIGTHPHEDHIGGMDDIIENFDIEKIFMPRQVADTKTYEDVLEAIDDANLKITAPKVGDTFFVGKAKCEVMGIENSAEELNETSIIIELTYGSKKFLFTGDAEAINESKRVWNDIDVLKVSHHGSRTSSSEDFLNQIKPEYAVISVGKNNDYGHPHQEVLKRFEGIMVYRTDNDGTILATCDGNEILFSKLNIDLDGNK